MYEGKHFNENVKQLSFLLIIVFLACLIIGNLNYFASSILGGLTMYMVLRKPHRYLLKKGWNNTLATIALLLLSSVILILLFGGLVSILYTKLKDLDPQIIVNGLRHIRNFAQEEWGYNIISEDIIQKALSMLGGIVPNILSTTGNVLANLIMMIFVLFFLLNESQAFERSVEKFLPMSTESIRVLKNAAHGMILGNAVGIPLIMLGQGFAAGLAYWILNAGDPIIWGVITGFFGLIPVIGTGGIWFPLAINLIIGGSVWQGIVLIIYGVLVISYVDNAIRIVLLRKTANVHPLVTLFGIILGMKLFGFWGIIFGPLLISFFFILVKIYKREFLIK